MSARDFDTIYAEATPHLRDELRAFRAAHPARHVQAGGNDWPYLTLGSGKATILWLVGGLRTADAAFHSMAALEDDFRIVAPSYPPVDTLAELADGLAAILAAEGLERVHVLAGSFGGMIAQVFVRRHPAVVDRVVLSNTTTPDGLDSDQYARELALIEPLPDEVVREAAKLRMFEIVSPPASEAAFWRAFFDEVYSVYQGKADVLSTYRCMLDFAANYRFAPGELDERRMLLIESEGDQTFKAEARAALRACYPGAQVHTFVDGGHSPTNTHRDAYFGRVRDFFNEA